jgi:hypothetical protein
VHPTLFEFHGIALHTYGLLLAIAFLLGIQLFVARARARGLPEEPMHTLALWLLVLAILGGRILFVLTHWGDYAADPLAILRLWEGGLMLYWRSRGASCTSAAAGFPSGGSPTRRLPAWRSEWGSAASAAS